MAAKSLSTARRLLAVSALLACMGFVVADDDAKKSDKQPEQIKKAPEKVDKVEKPAKDSGPPKFAPKKEPEKLAAVFSKRAPEDLDDLKAIQDQLEKTYEKVKPSVVCLKFGNVVGSGVIVTKDGYVLTAGHVSSTPNRPVSFIFYDGKSVKGITLGGNHGIDSGSAKITADAPRGEWPACEIGDSSKLKVGQWCFVCSHPGGYKPGRTPPVRLGRITSISGTTISTDCTLVGGDSGGPLFDMHGRVIGINSRIGNGITQNMHVPVNPFVDNWDKLAKAEVWGGNRFGGGGGKLPFPGGGGKLPAKSGVFLGVKADPETMTIQEVVADSPAEKAGVKVNDVILKVDGKEVAAADGLVRALSAKKVGDEVRLEVRRGDETLTLTATLAKRP